MSTVVAKAGQLRQIATFVFQAISELAPSARKVHAFIGDSEKVADFKTQVAEAFKQIALLNPYARERGKQIWFYPKGWTVPDLAVQEDRLLALFPGINLQGSNASEKRLVPKGADGLALLPSLRFLGKLLKIADPYGAGYGVIIGRLCELLSTQRDGAFHNYRKGELTEAYVRLYAEVRERLEQLEAATPGDVLVLPISFGNLYAGWSVRAARWEALDQEQLPLGGAHVACLLLVMPERLTAYEQLWIDCPGDEHNWYADGRWSRCLYFRFDFGQLGLTAHGADYADDGCGSVVAFRMLLDNGVETVG